MSSVTFVDELRQSVARMASGKCFQRRGAALENAFSPCVCTLHRGTSNRWASAERRSYRSAGNELVSTEWSSVANKHERAENGTLRDT